MAPQVASSLLVLDCWPIMEWLKGRQPATDKFSELVASAQNGGTSFAMSRLNHGEAVYTIRKAQDLADRKAALETFYALPITRYSVDDLLIDEAVELKSAYPIAYTDAFAAAFAMRLRVPLVTGDKEFLHLERDGILELLWVGA